MLILGMTYLFMLLAVLGVDFGSEEVNAQIIAAAGSISFSSACVAIFERICAVMLHIGLSMLVFIAAREKKFIYLYPTAILLHAMIDAPAALYQQKVLLSLTVVEGIAFIMAIISLALGCFMMRKYTRGAVS